MINFDDYEKLQLKDIEKVSNEIVFVLINGDSMIEIEDWSDDFKSIFTSTGTIYTKAETAIYFKKSAPTIMAANVVPFRPPLKKTDAEAPTVSKFVYACHCGSRFFIINLNGNVECTGCDEITPLPKVIENIEFINSGE